jgi:iron-sulfur cluster assembly protein
MAVQITESAAEQIRRVVASKGGLGVRLGVKEVGCSGLSYTYEVAGEIRDGDTLVEAHDAKLLVTREAAPIVEGAVLDYVREGFKQLFTVRNPNVKSTCGCGESFTV